MNLRIGIVLSPQGGALKKMLLPFQLGLGGKIGNGKQFMSWISIDDLLRLILHAITDIRISGPINAVSPKPISNADFSKTLARVLQRPALLPVPASLLKIAFGEFAEETLLASNRVLPAVAIEKGFCFTDNDLASTLRLWF